MVGFRMNKEISFKIFYPFVQKGKNCIKASLGNINSDFFNAWSAEKHVQWGYNGVVNFQIQKRRELIKHLSGKTETCVETFSDSVKLIVAWSNNAPQRYE